MDQLPLPLETKKKTWEELLKAGLREDKLSEGCRCDLLKEHIEQMKEKKNGNGKS